MIETSRISAEEPFGPSPNIGENEFSSNSVFFSSNQNFLSEQFCWRVNQSRIDFYSYDNNCQNRIVSRFNFEKIYNNPTLRICSVIRCLGRGEEFSVHHHPYKLVITLNTDADSSLIVIVDILANRVLSTILFPYIINSSELISSGNERDYTEILEPLNGLLAVGTIGGNVFLVDLRLDTLPEDPLVASQTTFGSIHNKTTRDEIAQKRASSLKHNQNLSFMVNQFAKKKNTNSNIFKYEIAGKDTIRYDAAQIYVTCLYYIPNSCSLVIGYNFGGLQIISLQTGNIDLEFSDDFVTHRDNDPVVAITHQLPEYDPKNFIYLWIVRGTHGNSLGIESDRPVCSRAYLYRFLFEDKEERHAPLCPIYRKFLCHERNMKFPLIYDPHNYDTKGVSTSNVLDLFAVQRHVALNSQEAPLCDNRYTILMWNAESVESDKVMTYFLIFDLNQWYSNLEPNSQRGDYNFMSFYSLQQLKGFLSNRDRIQGLYFETNTLSRFPLRGINNQHQIDCINHPRSLSFDVIISTQEKLFRAKFISIQKQALNNVFGNGTDVLSQPASAVNKLIDCGLVPLEIESFSPQQQQLSLLDVAIDNNLLAFLREFVRNDEQSILGWIGSQVELKKKIIDSNTVTLFNFSTSHLSPDEWRILSNCEHSLRVFTLLLKEFERIKKNEEAENFESFENQIRFLNEVIELVKNFWSLIVTFHNLNILPERLPQDCYGDLTCYDSQSLKENYVNARRTMIAKHENAFEHKHQVFTIDLIVHYFEEQFRQAWSTEEQKDTVDALYPPKNLHCLCRTFLLDQVPVLFREFVLIYFLLDYLMDNPKVGNREILQLFITDQMDSNMQDLVLGFWCADHGDLKEAFSFFISPNTLQAFKVLKDALPDLFEQLVHRVLDLFIIDKQIKMALQFIDMSDIFDFTEKIEVLYIFLLVSDRNNLAALEFIRRRRTEENAAILMAHMFDFCEQINTLQSICFHELDAFEELHFLSYLDSLERESFKLIILSYFLIKNRLMEALNFYKENSIDFSACPQMLELLESYDRFVPLKDLNAIARGKELLEAYGRDENGEEELQFDDNLQPRMKINPRKSSKKIISRTDEIEFALTSSCFFQEKKESPKRSLLTPTPMSSKKLSLSVRKSMGAFTPRLSTPSSIMKSKLKLSVKKKKNPFATMLQTPDVKRQKISDIITLAASRPPSSLKRLQTDSDSVSSDASKVKGNVKFRIVKTQESTNKNSVEIIHETPLQENLASQDIPDGSFENSLAVEVDLPANLNESASTRSSSPVAQVDLPIALGDSRSNTPEVAEVEVEVTRPMTPVRRSSRRSVTPSVESQPVETPTRRSSRRSATPSIEIQPIDTPSRRTSRRSVTPSVAVQPVDSRRSVTPNRNVRSSVSKDVEVQRPETPTRRSSRVSVTPSREIESRPRTPTRASRRSSVEPTEETVKTPGKRGRGRTLTTVEESPTHFSTKVSEAQSEETESEESAPITKTPKRVGRPPKVKSEETDTSESVPAVKTLGKRGKTTKVKSPKNIEEPTPKRGGSRASNDESAPTPKRVGRPPKALTVKLSNAASEESSTTDTQSTKDEPIASSQSENVPKSEPALPSTPKRGRKPKAMSVEPSLPEVVPTTEPVRPSTPKRGPKAKALEALKEAQEPEVATPKKRGRSTKVSTEEEEPAVAKNPPKKKITLKVVSKTSKKE